MHVSPAVMVLGFVAGTLGVASGWPQLMRLLRTRVVTGVSVSSQVLGLSCCVLWLSHGLFSRDVAQVVSNAVALIGAVGVVALLMRYGGGARERWSTAAALTGLVLVVGGLALADRPVLVATTAVTVSLARQVPQVAIAVLPGRSLRGLSPATLAIGAMCSTLWAVYGMLVGDPAIVTTSVIGACLTVFLGARRVPPTVLVAAARSGRFGPTASRVLQPGGWRRVRGRPGRPTRAPRRVRPAGRWHAGGTRRPDGRPARRARQRARRSAR